MTIRQITHKQLHSHSFFQQVIQGKRMLNYFFNKF